MSGQLHVLAALAPGYKSPLYPLVRKLGGPLWMQWRREEDPSLLLSRIEPQSSSPYPNLRTEWANPAPYISVSNVKLIDSCYNVLVDEVSYESWEVCTPLTVMLWPLPVMISAPRYAAVFPQAGHSISCASLMKLIQWSVSLSSCLIWLRLLLPGADSSNYIVGIQPNLLVLRLELTNSIH
jgi:hypothetical protein